MLDTLKWCAATLYFPLIHDITLHGLWLTEERWHTRKSLEEHSSKFLPKQAGYRIDTVTSELHLILQYTAAPWPMSSGLLYFFAGLSSWLLRSLWPVLVIPSAGVDDALVMPSILSGVLDDQVSHSLTHLSFLHNQSLEVFLSSSMVNFSNYTSHIYMYMVQLLSQL